MVIEWLLMVIKPIVISLYLVGGAITILKNDGVRHWEGWHPIYEMENKKIKNVWSHQPHLRPNCTRPHQEWCSRMGLTSFPSDGPEISGSKSMELRLPTVREIRASNSWTVLWFVHLPKVLACRSCSNWHITWCRTWHLNSNSQLQKKNTASK